MDEQIPNPCCTFIKFELKTLAFYGPCGFSINIQTGNERSLIETELEPNDELTCHLAGTELGLFGGPSEPFLGRLRGLCLLRGVCRLRGVCPLRGVHWLKGVRLLWLGRIVFN